MPLTKQQKAVMVTEIEALLKAQQGTVFVDFTGLSTKDLEVVKKTFKAEGVKMKLFRKTLLARALESTGFKVATEDFTGSVALVTSDQDALIPAKLTSTAAKKYKTYKLLGGLFEGRFVDLSELKALASIPSRHELLGQLVSVMQGPVRGFATSVNEIVAGFVRVLKAKADKTA